MWSFLLLIIFSILNSSEAGCSGNVGKCHWSPWESWGSCWGSCGGSFRTRSRPACCDTDLDFGECMIKCNMNRDDSSENGPCNNICYHGNFHTTSWTSYPFGHCICNRQYGGTCCDEPLCGWDGRWCWPGRCGSDNYERYCMCDYGFRKEKIGDKTMCQLTRRPTLLTCRAGLENVNGDAVNTTGTGKCYTSKSVYTNLHPHRLSFTIESSFKINVSSASSKSQNRIKNWHFGIVTNSLEISKKDMRGNRGRISHLSYSHGPECDHTISDRSPREMASCTGAVVPGQSLNNGESLCINFVPYAGGFFTTEDGSTETYKRTRTNKELCFMYDNHAPDHCTGTSSCRTSMLHVSHRVTDNSYLRVTFSSWRDPVPSGGSSNKASGIKQFTASLLRVEELDTNTLIMKYPGTSTQTVSASTTQLNFELPTEPALYAVLLEVHDTAGNVKMARRFTLYDNSSTVAILPKNLLQSLSASSKTNYSWQVHHGLTCFNWTGRYYNTYHVNINLLRRIKSEGNISISYDQTDGLIPVSGTQNVDGIVQFNYTWKLDKGKYKPFSTIADVSAQSFCENLKPVDGQTYTFKIKPIDVNSRTLEETSVIHIDRSPPSIDNVWIMKEGYKQLFVHNSSDLATMSLQFEALDIHSGLSSIQWRLGTSDGADDIGQGSLAVNRINGSCAGVGCYCPKIGAICEKYLYTVGLNKLVDRKTNKGQHNRNYYFTIIVTNNAKLVNIEHIDVLTDDSPPEEGVIQEGVAGSPDVDYTSEKEITVNWYGYIDHESGIKLYRIGFSDRCLSKEELDDYFNNTSKDTQIIETTKNTEKFRIEVDGFYISSIVAYNNAMEPSKVICSDGIQKDSTSPMIINVTLKHSKAMELFACDSMGPWHVRSDLTKVALSPTDSCMKRCSLSTFQYLQSLPEVKINSSDRDVADYLCNTLPTKVDNWYIYVPSNNIDISWRSLDADSQIRHEEIGFASDPSSTSSPDIEVYKATHGHSRYHNVHEGIDRGYPFYIMIRSTNKAGMDRTLAFGPVVIDDSPPICKKRLFVQIEQAEDKIYCSWENDTFIDPEQKHAVDYVLYKIGADDIFFTPFLQIPPEERCIRKDLKYCVHYPISKLQRQDEEKSLHFFFELYVYNMAGHFTTVRSPTFVLPSQFRPGNGHVIDVDPRLFPLTLPEIDRKYNDIDFHVSVGKICAVWTGFNHHKNVTFDIGVGTKAMSDDIIPFEATENSKSFKCFTSNFLQSNKEYFVTINATCSAGSRVVASDGVYIMDQTNIPDFINVGIGMSCDGASQIELEKHKDANSSKITYVSKVPLTIGHGYTIETDLVNELIRSDDVLWVNQTSAADTTLRKRFVAFRQTASFTIYTKNETYVDQFIMTLLDCFENITATSSLDSVFMSLSLRGDLSNLITGFKVSLFLDNCIYKSAHVPKLSCLKQQSEFQISNTDRRFKLENVSLIDGKVYRVGVKACFRHICLQEAFSSQLFVQSIPPTTSNIKASATNGNDTCLDVDISFAKFNCIRTCSLSDKYEWSISLSTSSDGILTDWQIISAAYSSKEDTIKVLQCVNVPVYLHRLMYVCVRGMCESGATATTCAQLEVPHPNEYNSKHVYELDSRNPSINDIKDNLHAQFLGQTLSLLHKSDINFCKKDTVLQAAIPNSDERNITWYLLTDKLIPSQSCERSDNCIKSLTSYGGFVTLHKTKLVPGNKYYICASSNRTFIERELFYDIQEEFNGCGNGFLIDDVPPTPGRVTIMNQHQGFMISKNEMIVSWKGFYDRLTLSYSNFSSSIYSYSYAIGTSPGSVDVVPFTSAGLSNSVKIRGLDLENGVNYYATVRATDHVNFSVEAYSEAVGVDFTPPKAGTVSVGGALRHKYVMAKQHLNVYWSGFKDEESGISQIYLGVGDQNDTDNILEFKIMTVQYADLSKYVFQDGMTYFAVLKVVNKAGKWTKVSSEPFILDASPPRRGVVRDGNSQQLSDVDFQNFTNSLSCHWEAFDDPNSGIQFYRVGLGTDPGQFDIHVLTEVGLKTEISWKSHLRAGEKYFCTVEACNGAGLCTRHHSDGIIMDDSPPISGLIHVGISGSHEAYQNHKNSISAHWVGFEDPQSDIHHFEWCMTMNRNSCDVFPFTNILLSQSGFKTQLNLSLGQDIFVKIKAYNNVGMFTNAISDSFQVDTTHPVLVKMPQFVLKNMQVSHLKQTQWEHSLIHVAWEFSDEESPIVRHVVRLVTHHDGKVRQEVTKLGNENGVTIQMPENDLLLNGDRYWATVTACNSAGLCTNATSEELLIDSSPPQVGGFKPPMTWFKNGNVSQINLSWYGFSDVESMISKYMITVSKTYSGSELSGGVVTIEVKNKSIDSSSILLKKLIFEEDDLILSIWAINGVGLRSSIGKVTVTAVQTDTTGSAGILKLKKHSCMTHYCNHDCTCAVVGEKCEQRPTNLTCVNVENRPQYQIIRVLVGMEKNHQAITASSSCLSAHWEIESDQSKVGFQRFEWSIGAGKPGDGIFDDPSATKWFDVDLQTNLTFCMPPNRLLVHSENYTVFIKAWYSEKESRIFSSPPVTIDTTPPDMVRGKYIFVSTDNCESGVLFITNVSSIHVCWQTVFKDRISGIIKYFVMAGTSPYGDDLLPVSDYGLAEKAEFKDLPMSPGTKYYFTIRVLNSVGLMTSLASEGIVLDIEPPFEGIVFNTEHHKNDKFQASRSTIGSSWHGFNDHHSHIHHYSAWVTEVSTGKVIQIQENLLIRTSVSFNGTTLRHGESYKVSVQAFDAAGYESSVVDSERVTIDSTPPQSFSCRNFTDVDRLDNYTLGLKNITFSAVLRNENFYKMKLKLKSLSYFLSVQIAIGHHVMILQMSENADSSRESEMHFLSPYNGTTKFSIAFNEPVNHNSINIEFLECSDIDLETTETAIDVAQFSQTQISVCPRILDPESQIRSIEVGIGTVRGGFQVHPLTPIPLENHLVIEHNSPHGTKLYVTAIAHNHAGLWTAFESNEIIVDHTPPQISNIKAEMTLDQVDNSTDDRIAHVSITAHVHDQESGVKACSCIIEKKQYVAGNVTTLDNETIVSCQLDNDNFKVKHGAVIASSIVCINNAELIVKESGPQLCVSFKKPSSADATLHIFPDNEMSVEKANNNLYGNNTIQTSLSVVHARWTGFHDISGIDYYAYTLKNGITTLATDTTHDTRTTAMIGDVLLEDGESYTMYVEAVNTGGLHSKPAVATFRVDSRSPKLSGENLQIDRTDSGSKVIDWSRVFEKRNDMKLIYVINVGSREGYSEVIDRFETKATSVVLPEIPPDSVWVSVCGRYVTGKYNCIYETVVL